jgi:hypothetical protein
MGSEGGKFVLVFVLGVLCFVLGFKKMRGGINRVMLRI